MWALGFLLVLAIAVLVRAATKKLLPMVMPPSRLKTLLAVFIGALAGTLLFRLCHLGDATVVAEANLIGAFLGAVVFLLLFGLYPFIKVFLGKA